MNIKATLFTTTVVILWAITAVNANANYMLLPIDEVYDGDTIKTHISERRLPAPLNKISIRILGIDTPENPAKSYLTTGKLGRASCVKEAELALKAKAAVVDLIKHTGSTKMKVENFKWGKFGGRVVGSVKIAGVDVAQHLILRGLAVQYDGGTKTKDWCQ